MTVGKFTKSNYAWHWVQLKEGSILQSEHLLRENFKHGFFTKEWKGKGPNELSKIFSKTASIHQVKQVHSNKVLIANKVYKPIPNEADGLINSQKNQSLWIYSADCLPVLFADPETGNVAASHAGWRGLAARILIKTINKLERNGSAKKQLLVAIGPAIAVEHYEVGASVINSIKESLSAKLEYSTSEDYIRNILVKEFSKFDKKSNKFKLNLKKVALKQLLNAGIEYKNINVSSICTFSENHLFNSWRRDKTKKRQWSVIIS